MGWKAGIWFLSLAVFMFVAAGTYYALVIRHEPMQEEWWVLILCLALVAPQLFLNETKEDRELWGLKKELKRTELLIKQHALEGQLNEVRSREK